MSNIKLPDRFKKKIELNQNLEGIVKTTLSNFGEILEENKLFFFGEYTDHGIKHIENVLTSSENLITDHTIDKILETTDISYYILSVILHDIGMHINIDGFLCLLNGEFDDTIIKEFDLLTWNELWMDFLKEATKFSGKQLKSIFGDEKTIIRIPPLSTRGQITENDKKLIGEFIRRNHARLAHEIAIKGFPGNPDYIDFATGLDKKTKNIIGLVARSHGMGLRKCMDYIETVFGRENRKHPNNCHVTYLMILLRIADYVQIDSGRIFKKLLRVKTFSSPLSEMEQNSHLAIEQVEEKYHDDPERIFVTAAPKDSEMYLKLIKLISDIQHEFDISWAVLGEIYGANANKPEIKYRRITSNLEDEKFLSNQEYVADNFSFKANDEITKLLIAPLYGNDIKFGFRELIQNSIDACKEREISEKGKPYKPLIKIEIVQDADSTLYVLITDNGIGMDANVIKNYFLCSGASYRKSLEWQKEFTDKKGKITVQRSGRFGIGILASFLIGKEIYVDSKKIGNNIGYKFKADLNTEQINIIKSEEIEQGTRIKILITKETVSKLELNNTTYFDYQATSNLWYKWYTLTNPQIKYFMFGKELIPYKTFDPDLNEKLPIKWNSINSEGFKKILWTYSNVFSKNNFTCNGLVIPVYNLGQGTIDLGLIKNVPKISVFDYNAFLPLTLNRNSFSDKLSFSHDLKIDIYKDFIAYILCLKTFKNYVKGEKIYFQMPGWPTQTAKYPGTEPSYSDYYTYPYGSNLYDKSLQNGPNFFQITDDILISKRGFILNYNYFINKIGKLKTVLIQSETLSYKSDFIDLDIKDRFLILSNKNINSIEDYKIAIEPHQFDNKKNVFLPFNSRIFLKTEKYNYLFKSKSKRVSQWLNNKCKVKSTKDGWVCLHLDEPEESLFNEIFLKKYSKEINFIREYEIFCQEEGDIDFNNLLKRYLGDNVIIPYSREERKKKYPLAFKELERYMKKYLFNGPTFMWDSDHKGNALDSVQFNKETS